MAVSRAIGERLLRLRYVQDALVVQPDYSALRSRRLMIATGLMFVQLFFLLFLIINDIIALNSTSTFTLPLVSVDGKLQLQTVQWFSPFIEVPCEAALGLCQVVTIRVLSHEAKPSSSSSSSSSSTMGKTQLESVVGSSSSTSATVAPE